MNMPYNKKGKESRFYKKKQKRGKQRNTETKTALDRKIKREFDQRKELEEFIADMELLDENIFSGVAGKLSTFMHKNFHKSDLRINHEADIEKEI